MRLIDADELMCVMQKACEREQGYGTPLAMIHLFMNIITKQPTAYDVDAVVKELKKESYVAMCLNTECRYVNLDKAIEIVRGGVK